MIRQQYVAVSAFVITIWIFSPYVAANTYTLFNITTLSPDIEMIENLDRIAINIKKNPLTIPTESLDINGQSVLPPFIINTVFKADMKVTTCIFSLMSAKKKPIFNLCIIPVGPSQFIVSIYGIQSSIYEEIKFSHEIEDKWTTMMLYIDTNTVTLKLDCTDIVTEVFEETVPGIDFSKGTQLIFGYTTEETKHFAVAIQDVYLYTDADETLVNFICNDYRIFNILNDTSTDSYSEISDYKGERGEPGERGEKGERGEAGLQGNPGDKGLKGEKGEKGDTGHKGEPGNSIIGPQGPPGLHGKDGEKGLRGLKGDMGECQCSETVVRSLLTIMPEMRGLPGEQGYPGDPGPKGLTGNTGLQGEKGTPGLRGDKGDKGDTGAPGLKGEVGLKGDAGIVGAPGPQGAKGEEGQPGPPGRDFVRTDEKGKSGEKGDRGPEGPIGIPGLKGDMGPMGPKGEVGERGEKGYKGSTGIEGPRGEKGVIGDPGKNGLRGVPGRHGNHGAQGEKGDRGDKGAPGLAGLPASLASILDTEINPEENAAIIEKLRGYKGNKGEKGDKGDKGDQGPTGMMGPSGEDGKDGIDGRQGIQGLKGEVGPIGPRGYKGDQGEPGSPGVVPASHIALMKGPKGDQGRQGRTGPQGRPGNIGARGATGPRGPKGSKGDKGPIGAEGKMGRPGINGSVGEKGQKGESQPPVDVKKLKGEKGESGNDGIPGIPGKEGPQGPPGSPCQETTTSVPIVGPPGSPGLPGPPGPPGVSIIGPKGEPGNIIAHRTDCAFSNDFYSGNPDEEDEVCTSSTVIYKTSKALLKRTATTPLGTLAYILREKILLLRVDYGWQHVAMGSLFQYREPEPNDYSFTTPPPKEKQRQIHLAALNQPYSGRIFMETNSWLSGYNAANTICHHESLSWRRKFNSTFVAFLASRVSNLMSLVKESDRELPVVNLKGKTLFKSWKEMFSGSGAMFGAKQPDIYSFNRKNVLIDFNWPQKLIWHGSDKYGNHSNEAMCQEWRSDSPNIYGLASPLHSNSRLLDQKRYSCDKKFIVLCVQISGT